MALILLSGVALGALSRPSQLVAALLFSVATVILTASILGALYARGASRAFWSGFAIGGWMYLLLQYGPFCETSIGPYTLPTAILDVLYDALAPGTPPPMVAETGAMSGMSMMPGMSNGMGMAMPGMMGSTVGIVSSAHSPRAWDAWVEVDRGRVWAGTRAHSSFFRIGHSLLCLVAGLAAGLLARWWAERGRGEV
jgi:hypothetical protein